LLRSLTYYKYFTFSRSLISTQTPLSSIVAGPVVRHCDVDQVNFWLVTTQKYSIACKIVMVKDHNVIFDKHLDSAELQQIQVGKQAFINLISIKVTDGLPENELLAYDCMALVENLTLKVVMRYAKLITY